ncbi:DUF6415 family natural product biosynthesis protein [Streptomyces olivochromogenes]|nr:DUF6415 family natural product biosynthesis protein [Streptomyces olivochromogenes]
MRETSLRLLGPDAQLPTWEELETLILTLRGMIMLAIPEVEILAQRLSREDIPRYCALACIGDARQRLDLVQGHGLPAGIAHARKLSRALNALCDHHVALSNPALPTLPGKPTQEAS